MTLLAVQQSCCTAAYEAASLPFKRNRVTFYEPPGPPWRQRHTHGFVILTFTRCLPAPRQPAPAGQEFAASL